MPTQPILINGQWRSANDSSTFRAENPATKEPLPEEYPVSTWADCEAALAAAKEAAAEMRSLSGDKIAAFLESFAAKIE
ncbi:MAG: aldehyde dehydrogenase (NADP(+)), partial [Planctomycetales bacterium]|nr:aldehyde dehydrogenase (NADP(+)) [Planctomycetales bacterium]